MSLGGLGYHGTPSSSLTLPSSGLQAHWEVFTFPMSQRLSSLDFRVLGHSGSTGKASAEHCATHKAQLKAIKIGAANSASLALAAASLLIGPPCPSCSCHFAIQYISFLKRPHGNVWMMHSRHQPIQLKRQLLATLQVRSVLHQPPNSKTCRPKQRATATVHRRWPDMDLSKYPTCFQLVHFAELVCHN